MTHLSKLRTYVQCRMFMYSYLSTIYVFYTGQLNPVNGYESNSHSPCDIVGISKESVESVESGESCDDDEMEGDNNRLEEDEKDDSLSTSTTSRRQQHCGSPVAPLSLITHKNNANSTNSSPVSAKRSVRPLRYKIRTYVIRVPRT